MLRLIFINVVQSCVGRRSLPPTLTRTYMRRGAYRYGALLLDSLLLLYSTHTLNQHRTVPISPIYRIGTTTTPPTNTTSYARLLGSLRSPSHPIDYQSVNLIINQFQASLDAKIGNNSP